MKLLCLLGLVGLSFAARAQSPARAPPLPGLPFDSLTHAPAYRGVVAVPGQPAAELHARAREWVALTFQDAYQVTQLDDAGLLDLLDSLARHERAPAARW